MTGPPSSIIILEIYYAVKKKCNTLQETSEIHTQMTNMKTLSLSTWKQQQIAY